MRLHVPNAPPWTAPDVRAISSTQTDPEENDSTQGDADGGKEGAHNFRDVVDFCFVRKISETRMAPLMAMTTALTFFRLRDPTCRLFSPDRTEEWELPSDLPEKPDDFRTKLQYQTIRMGRKMQKHVFSVHIEMKTSIAEQKKDNAALREFLDEQRLYIEARTLGSAATTVLGWFAKAHPRATNYRDFEREIIKTLRGVKADPKVREIWELNLSSTEKSAINKTGSHVPPIRVFTSRKRFRKVQTDVKSDITLETLQIKTATQHKNWVLHLLSKAAAQNQLPLRTRFVPHWVQTGDISLPGIVRGHLTYVENLRIVPIVGLPREAMEVVDSNRNQTYREYLCRELRAESLQPTNRTTDLGKWLVLVTKQQFASTLEYLDDKLPSAYEKDIPPQLRLSGFPCPRRTSIPRRVIGEYADTLKRLGEEGLALPEIKHQGPRRRPRQMHFEMDASQFPPLRQKGEKRAQDKGAAERKPGQRTDQSALQKRLDDMERKTQERLQKIEAKHDQDIQDLLVSIQGQFDTALISMQTRIEQSNRVMKGAIKEHQEQMTKQINELVGMVNLLTTKIVGRTDHHMSEAQQSQLLRPVLEEPQLRKKVREDEPADSSATESPEATPHTQDEETDTNDHREDTLSTPSPHTNEGAYDVLHLWR